VKIAIIALGIYRKFSHFSSFRHLPQEEDAEIVTKCYGSAVT
jgi:hypothetical protein